MTEQTPVQPDTLDYEPEPEEEWLEEPEELPRRPRHKLLGAGANPIPLTLFVVLLLAGAFFAGVEVEKGETSSTSSSGLPSGIAALRSRLAGGATSTGGAKGTTGSGFPTGAFRGAGGGGGFPAAGGGGFAGLAGGGLTTGEVSFANGNTLYVTTGEGNTVKVSAPQGTKVTKTVSTDVHGIHPGDTVIVRGSQNKNGSVSASSIAISSAGGSAGSSAAGGTGGSGAVQLFGN